MTVKHPIWMIVSTWKSDKLQNQYMHEFLVVVITTEHVALPNNIQHFI